MNDAPKRFSNCIAKAAIIDDAPRVLLFASSDIDCGMELRYDYAGVNYPWRKVLLFVLLPVSVSLSVWDGACSAP